MSITPTFSEQINNISQTERNNKFGQELPIPFIEKFTIKDDDGFDTNGNEVGSFEVQAAVYLNLNHYGSDNINHLLPKMSNIRPYIMLAYDREHTYTSSSNDTIVDNTLTDVITKKRTILSAFTSSLTYVMPSGSSNPGKTMSVEFPQELQTNVYALGSLDTWSVADTYYLDGVNLPVVKLITSTTIAQNMMDDNASSNTDLMDYVNKGYSYNNIQNVGALCFSTVLDLASRNGQHDIITAYQDKDPMRYLYAGLTSDINSLIIVKDKEVNQSPNTVYIGDNNNIYNDALQGLDNLYYASGEVDLPALVGFFKALASTSELSDLQSVYDTFLTLLETNDTNTSILLEINQFLDTFVEKSSATPIGRFYLRTQKRLTQANKLVISGPRVRKIQLTNPIIMDLRTNPDTNSLSWTTPEPDDYSDEDFIYTKSILLNRKGLDLSDEGGYDRAYWGDQGRVFFDFQKALLVKSKMAQHLDPRKIIHHFGQSVVMNHFHLDSATLLMSLDAGCRSESGECSEVTDLFKLHTNFNSLGESTGPNTQRDLEIRTYTDQAADQLIQTDPVPSMALLGDTYYALRNFNTSKADVMTSFNNDTFYRLMCFDFNIITTYGTYYDSEVGGFLETGEEKYTFTFNLRDTTNALMVDIITIFINAHAKLLEYRNYAEDACSHNKEDGWFNEFFIEGVQNYYDNNNEIAPWLSVPYAYVLLQDMFFNTYEGDKAAMQDAARLIGDTISPYSGDLANLTEFLIQFGAILPDTGVFGDVDVTDTEEVEITLSTEWCDFPTTYTDHPFDEEEYVEEEEEEDTSTVPDVPTSWTKGKAHTKTGWGINFNDDELEDFNTTVGRNWFADTFGSGMTSWTKTGPVWEEIKDFAQSYDNKYGQGRLFLQYTTPTADGDGNWVTYLMVMYESESKFKLREYKCAPVGGESDFTSHPGSGCGSAPDGDDSSYGKGFDNQGVPDEVWEISAGTDDATWDKL
tara:strand:+ start:310 stop:3234 length:2925 start_codon:yes stop_codon:yes gene_type:complete